jgi:hypothetical protein
MKKEFIVCWNGELIGEYFFIEKKDFKNFIKTKLSEQFIYVDDAIKRLRPDFFKLLFNVNVRDFGKLNEEEIVNLYEQNIHKIYEFEEIFNSKIDKIYYRDHDDYYFNPYVIDGFSFSKILELDIHNNDTIYIIHKWGDYINAYDTKENYLNELKNTFNQETEEEIINEFGGNGWTFKKYLSNKLIFSKKV